jgi:hypothetical protein
MSIALATSFPSRGLSACPDSCTVSSDHESGLYHNRTRHKPCCLMVRARSGVVLRYALAMLLAPVRGLAAPRTGALFQSRMTACVMSAELDGLSASPLGPVLCTDAGVRGSRGSLTGIR